MNKTLLMSKKSTVIYGILTVASLCLAQPIKAQTTEDNESIGQEHRLRDVVVKAANGTR